MRGLQGKRVLVSGGSSGIGLATARRFLEEGSRVFLTGLDPREVASALASLGRGGGAEASLGRGGGAEASLRRGGGAEASLRRGGGAEASLRRGGGAEASLRRGG